MPIKKKLQDFKRELILEEAGRLFIEEGYDAMKIADLAKNVGLSVGTIYNFFGSKENLYNNYILSVVDHAMAIVEQSIQQYDDPIEKLREITRIKFGLITTHKLAMKESINDPSFFLHMSVERDNPMMQFYHYLAEEVMRPLAETFNSPKEPMELVFLYDGLGVGAIKYWMACGGDLMERVDENIAQFVHLLKECR